MILPNVHQRRAGPRVDAWLRKSAPEHGRYGAAAGAFTLISTFAANTKKPISRTLAPPAVAGNPDSWPESIVPRPTMKTGSPTLCSQKWIRARRVVLAAGYT